MSEGLEIGQINAVYDIKEEENQSKLEFIRQINESSILYLHQKFDALKILGCVAQRQYKLYGENYQNQPISNKPIVYAKENSSCFTRHFCPTDYQPFQMNLFKKQSYITEEQKGNKNVKEERNILIQLDRKFRCTFYCLFRPFLDVKINTLYGTQKLIGRICDPFDFCPLREWLFEGVDILDSQDNLLYIVETSKLQCGILLSSFCCKPCQEVVFKIINPIDRSVIGTIEKKSSKCFKNMVSDQSNFKINFPLGIGFEQKILLLAATFFIQANMFVQSPSEQQENIEDILENFS